MARKIAERCPSSTTKSDLLAYLGRITLYCHQLTITSKVKADVHNVSGELVVSGERQAVRNALIGPDPSSYCPLIG